MKKCIISVIEFFFVSSKDKQAFVLKCFIGLEEKMGAEGFFYERVFVLSFCFPDQNKTAF